MPPPRRRVSKQAIRYALLVFVEGAVTEEQYLKHLHRRNRLRVHVDVDEFRGDPLSLVRRAIDAKKREERAERRGRGRAHDEVWCVFDVDEHPDLKHAISLAREHGISLAISNPCLELWFLLHFQDQTGFMHRHEAQAAAEEHTECDKTLTEAGLAMLDAGYPDAKDRARHLEAKHEGDGTSFPDDNPSSGVWRIVDSIELGNR
jgi:RloB-like protein